ncbi:e03d7628-5563-49cd-a79c-545d6b463dcd [Thermothielavioides terrestris]|uniref:E03d7628-5563-49cd-a79c-545d6b463dcd n=1 Tax=Thermothielavioides terrestris TaxID=2587410 RepID=A0A446BSM9_9PEZI|nr:e03d7628-5563-49cd-a79c-545d6b463dcd [Thermothielavioides terrestris]
MVLGDHLTS